MQEYQAMVSDAPERIFRMAEADTSDASQRLNDLTKAEIEQAKTDRATASIFLLLFGVSAIVFFAIGNLYAGLALLSVPLLAVIKTMWSTPLRKTDPTPKPKSE